jgi:FixJ family two-component response regulator
MASPCSRKFVPVCRILPVVLMTAYAEVDKAVDAMRSGACDFLLKPFEPAGLAGAYQQI